MATYIRRRDLFTHTRRRSSCVAPCCRRAGAGDAGDRFPQPSVHPTLNQHRGPHSNKGSPMPVMSWARTLGSESASQIIEPSLLPRLATDLVDRKVAVIVATGSPYAALAAKAATSTIPIVFAVAEDPVRYGLVTSLSRPGGTATGMTFLSAELVGKRLNLLLELLPKATTIAYLSGPSISPIFEDRKSEILAAARAVGREIIVVEVRRFDFEAAFATLVEQGADALIVGNFSFFLNPLRNRDQILELAARHKIITIYPNRMYVAHGGLMSYDSDSMAVVRQLGSHYVGGFSKVPSPPTCRCSSRLSLSWSSTSRPLRRSALPYRRSYSHLPTR